MFKCFFRVCISKASLFETFKALVSDIPCEKLPLTLRYLPVRTHSSTYMLIPGVYPNVNKKKLNGYYTKEKLSGGKDHILLICLPYSPGSKPTLAFDLK